MITTVKMRAPLGASVAYLPDGSTKTVDSNGFIDCPIAFINTLENSGWTVEAGEFSSATVGNGFAISAVQTYAKRICADDAGAALPAGSFRAEEIRMLLATALGATDTSIGGAEGHLKVVADGSASIGHLYGLWGYLEMSAAGKVNVGAGVYGMLDCPSGAVVASVGACFLAGSNDLRGTHTGPIVGFAIQNPVAGTFDGAFSFGGSSGAISNHAAGSPASKQLLIYIDGVQYAINICAVGS